MEIATVLAEIVLDWIEGRRGDRDTQVKLLDALVLVEQVTPSQRGWSYLEFRSRQHGHALICVCDQPPGEDWRQVKWIVVEQDGSLDFNGPRY